MGVQEPTSWTRASSLAPFFMLLITQTCTRKSASVEPASKTVSKAESQGPEKIFAQVLQPPYNGDHKNGSQVSTVAGGHCHCAVGCEPHVVRWVEASRESCREVPWLPRAFRSAPIEQGASSQTLATPAHRDFPVGFVNHWYCLAAPSRAVGPGGLEPLKKGRKAQWGDIWEQMSSANPAPAEWGCGRKELVSSRVCWERNYFLTK